MIRKVLGAIRKQRLFAPGETVVVAVSGGADSVALLHVLAELARPLDLHLVAAHLNHGLRGAEADADAAFVEALARRLGIPCKIQKRNVSRFALQHGVSLEMAARRVRYDFLRRVAAGGTASVVATGHTVDDQAETVLLRLTRGAGMRGVAGIDAANSAHGIRVVRPLLSVTRREIEAYLRKHDITWREDASNLDSAFLRNRVRNEVLPLMRERLNPCVDEALCRAADILSEDEAWLTRLASDVLSSCMQHDAVDIASLHAHPVAARRRAVRMWLEQLGVDTGHVSLNQMRQIDGLVTRRSGSAFVPLSGGIVVMRDAGALRVAARPADPVPVRHRLKTRGETLLPSWGLRIMIERGPGIHKPRRSRPGQLPAAASLSAAAVGRKALFLRTWRPGDRMRPLGMHGTRKLQDIFGDSRVPASRRHTVPILECSGEIVWIPGYRVARGWEVSEDAHTALQIRIDPI